MRLYGLGLTAIILTGSVLLGAGKPALSEEKASGSVVKLEKLTWAKFQERLASNKQARYTIVNAWSTTCGPCKENFPHIVEMHRKYASQGLAVISLSLDDPADKAAVAEAEKFLQGKNAVFTNVLLDESFPGGFEKLNIDAIPAVFLYGPDGKEIKRFTMDDPNNQFTYDEVEKVVSSLLAKKS